MANILVTGGAGFIGSHLCKALHNNGHNPIVFDNLSRGHRHNVKWGPLIEGDLHDYEKLRTVLEDHDIEAVVHLAAYAYVGESVENPQLYFENNVCGSVLLFEAMKDSKVRNLVFSSSCATYGESIQPIIDESHPQLPINPYGLSKLMVENILRKYQAEQSLKPCCLRYFNAAGSDPELEIGEEHDPEPHVIPNIIAAHLHGNEVCINGDDYPTPDGTCVRDFIHVMDLADAHILIVNQQLNEKEVDFAYNVGVGQGYSIKELIDEVSKQTGTRTPIHVGPRRPGDPASLVADSSHFYQRFQWQPQRSDLPTLIKDALAWMKKKSMAQDPGQ